MRAFSSWYCTYSTLYTVATYLVILQSSECLSWIHCTTVLLYVYIWNQSGSLYQSNFI